MQGFRLDLLTILISTYLAIFLLLLEDLALEPPRLILLFEWNRLFRLPLSSQSLEIGWKLVEVDEVNFLIRLLFRVLLFRPIFIICISLFFFNFRVPLRLWRTFVTGFEEASWPRDVLVLPFDLGL